MHSKIYEPAINLHNTTTSANQYMVPKCVSIALQFSPSYKEVYDSDNAATDSSPQPIYLD